MEIIRFRSQPKELPLRAYLSFEYLFKKLESYINDKEHPYYRSSKKVLKIAEQFPELWEGIQDLDQLGKYEEVIRLITEPLFPEPLQSNEIKAIVMPFRYIGLRPTTRFNNILNNAGEGFQMNLSGFDDDKIYFYACSFILEKYYHQSLNFTRPMYVDIPDKTTGILRHYRILFNADFAEIIKTDLAPELSQDDIDELLRHGQNLELWKEKFPPGGYIFKGFGVMNLYDATLDTTISKIRSLFLRNDDNVFAEFQDNLRVLFGINDLQVGYSAYDTKNNQILNTFLNKESKSLFLDTSDECNYHELFCHRVTDMVMKETKTIAITDVEQYGNATHGNVFYQKMSGHGIKSIILAPIKLDGNHLQLLELASPRKNALNALNASKLDSILPFVKIASKRYVEERKNLLESIIQENYTSIHPSVKWRFIQAATHFNNQQSEGVERPVLEEVVFEKVYPLYGQSDIKGSSTARNEAIKADLEFQLSLVVGTLRQIKEINSLPIYKKLIFRVNKCLDSIKEGLNAGDEVKILDFLKKEIYPVFNHLETLGPEPKRAVKEYMAHIDPVLNVIYKKRKDYDNSVTILNEKLSALLDRRQEEAQEMFPHYFQRYNTDGVEYNMYIGASLVENRPFDLMYLHNLRLWQLETMWDIEQRAHELFGELPYPLQVASLILIHSNPLAIKFMMDGKQFDVDGAYNARYEIIKKRIDKSHIKDTNERLTQPGKLAIVYSQESDAHEYLKYIEYMQARKKYGEVEMLELEDLQGVSGLKAIRVEVLYNTAKPKAKKAIVANGRQIKEAV